MRAEIVFNAQGRKNAYVDYVSFESQSPDGNVYIDLNANSGGESEISEGCTYIKDVAFGEEPANGRVNELMVDDLFISDIQIYDMDTEEELINVLPLKSISVSDGDTFYDIPENLITRYNQDILEIASSEAPATI